MNRHTCRFKVKESQIFCFLKILQENNIIVGVVKNTPPLTKRVKMFDDPNEISIMIGHDGKNNPK